MPGAAGETEESVVFCVVRKGSDLPRGLGDSGSKICLIVCATGEAPACVRSKSRNASPRWDTLCGCSEDRSGARRWEWSPPTSGPGGPRSLHATVRYGCLRIQLCLVLRIGNIFVLPSSYEGNLLLHALDN